MLLETSMSLSESLSRLVMGLNRQPQLLARIQGDMTGDESGERKSIVELAADVIQKIFTSCLTDRSSDRRQPPRGKKVAVYLFANLTLKLLFAVRYVAPPQEHDFMIDSNSVSSAIGHTLRSRCLPICRQVGRCCPSTQHHSE